VPEPKSPEEVGRTIHPKYCHYHKVINHPLEKSITLKERIIQLAKNGRIILDLDKMVDVNHTSISFEHHAPLVSTKSEPFGLLGEVKFNPFAKR